jgi:hypothetical protein
VSEQQPEPEVASATAASILRFWHDPALALANTNMDEWLTANPCECEALCTCPVTN